MHVLINISVNSGGSFNPGAVNTQMAQMGTSLNMFGGETRQDLSLCLLWSFALTAVVINSLFSIKKGRNKYFIVSCSYVSCVINAFFFFQLSRNKQILLMYSFMLIRSYVSCSYVLIYIMISLLK